MEEFKSLSYYPVESDFRIEGDFEAADFSRGVSLDTTSGDTITLVKAGTVHFSLEGRNYTMTVFKNNDLPEFGDDADQLFIPFKDATNGGETYEHGRYLPVDAPAGGKILLDFNRAMNPYSAFNEGYSSVIAPPDNYIEASVVSGERKYEDR